MFKENSPHNQRVIEDAIRQLDDIIARTPEFIVKMSQQAKNDPQWVQREQLGGVTEHSEISDGKN
jgi:hypothetical protein